MMIIPHSPLMMEAVRTSETSIDNHFTRQYTPENNSEHHTRCRENLKSSFHTLSNSIHQWRAVRLRISEADKNKTAL
jgi:hypothetical protein